MESGTAERSQPLNRESSPPAASVPEHPPEPDVSGQPLPDLNKSESMDCSGSLDTSRGRKRRNAESSPSRKSFSDGHSHSKKSHTEKSRSPSPPSPPPQQEKTPEAPSYASAAARPSQPLRITPLPPLGTLEPCATAPKSHADGDYISALISDTRRQAGIFESNEVRAGDPDIIPVQAPIFSASGKAPKSPTPGEPRSGSIWIADMVGHVESQSVEIPDRDIISFVVLSRKRDDPAGTWNVPPVQCFNDYMSLIEGEILERDLDVGNAFAWCNNWGPIGLLGLFSAEMVRLSLIHI